MSTTCIVSTHFENNPQKVVFAGQLLRGTVRLICSEEKSVQRLFIDVHGEAYAQWNKKNGKRSVSYSGKKKYLSFNKTFLGNRNALPTKLEFLHFNCWRFFCRWMSSFGWNTQLSIWMSASGLHTVVDGRQIWIHQIHGRRGVTNFRVVRWQIRQSIHRYQSRQLEWWSNTESTFFDRFSNLLILRAQLGSVDLDKYLNLNWFSIFLIFFLTWSLFKSEFQPVQQVAFSNLMFQIWSQLISCKFSFIL